jgi:Ca2+-binding EF-hand superfamily protein
MKTQAKFVFEAILIIAVVIAITAIPRAASAESERMHEPPTFGEFDANADGSVSEEEFNAMHTKHMAEMAEGGHKMRGMGNGCSFDAIDTDGDGAISEAELAAHQQSHRAEMHGKKMHHEKMHGEVT